MESANIAVIIDSRRSKRLYVIETKLCVIGSLVVGVVSMILGFWLYCRYEDYRLVARYGFSIWTGAIIIVTAFIGMCSLKWKFNLCLIITHLIFNTLIIILASLCIVVYSGETSVFATYRDDKPCYDTLFSDAVLPPSHNTTVHGLNMTLPEPGIARQCSGPPEHWKSALVVYLLLITTMFIQLAIAVISIVLSSKSAGCCNCCHGPQLAYRADTTGQFVSSENVKQVPDQPKAERGEWTNNVLMVASNETIQEKKPIEDSS